MNKLANLALAAFAITLGAACEPVQDGPDANAWAESALPDQRILVNMPVDDGSRAVGQTADSYVWTRNATQHVNGLIGFVLVTVDTITDYQPTFSNEDNEFFWGPWNDGGLDPNETGLYVAHDEEAGTYGWAIVQRPKDSTDDADWTPVVAGEATPGDTEDTGTGFFVIDFDAINALNPAETATGRFATNYVIDAAGVSAEAAFEGFSEDGGPTANALYRYDQDATGAGAMDLGLEADTDDEGAAAETIVLRTRWQADGQGRGDMVVFGGDLGEAIVAGSQCWDGNFVSVYEATSLFTQDGDETLCAFEAAEWNDEAPAPDEQ